MKTGTHNLGSNAFAQLTIAKVGAGGLTIRQLGPNSEKSVTLSANQIELLKGILT